MKLRRRRRSAELHQRMVWQGSALLLARPDHQLSERIQLVAEMLGHLDGGLAMPMGRAIAELQQQTPAETRRAYDQVFGPSIERDLRLTTWIAGTTREQVVHVRAFTDAYRAAGVERPRGEAHDHLAVVLEFAAHVDPEAGRQLLESYRVPIAALARTAAGSPYAHVLAAVCTTLPQVAGDDVDRLLGVPTQVHAGRRPAPNGT